MNAATSVNVKKSTLINYGGHNIRETTSTSFSVARQSVESETDAGNFSVNYVSAFSVARQSAKSETGTLIFGSVKFGSVVVFFFLTLTLIATFVKRTDVIYRIICITYILNVVNVELSVGSIILSPWLIRIIKNL